MHSFDTVNTFCFIKILHYRWLITVHFYPALGLINKKRVKRKGLQSTMSVRLPPIMKFAAGKLFHIVFQEVCHTLPTIHFFIFSILMNIIAETSKRKNTPTLAWTKTVLVIILTYFVLYNKSSVAFVSNFNFGFLSNCFQSYSLSNLLKYMYLKNH